MRACLKALHSPDLDLATFSPEAENDFGFLLQMLIGPDGGDGAESFDLTVCTPRWFERNRRERDEAAYGLHTLFVSSYGFGKLKRFLERHIARIHGDTWHDMTSTLRLFGYWEFEGQ